MPNYITKYCIIRDQKVIIDNNIAYTQEDRVDFPAFIRSLYKHYKIEYPNFYKMDNLSKLAFITSELLFKENDFLSSYNNEETGIVISNSNSSLDTDNGFYDTIKDRSNYYPSPSVFVYTLPNIMTGEICIRNNIKGENAFFVFEKFEPVFISNYVNDLFNAGKVSACITGWVDLFGDNYESFLYLVEKESRLVKTGGNNVNKNNIIFMPQNIKELYKAEY